jgi:bifunctional non-homologous end joining protein LigD
MALDEYQRKRNFKATPEPAGKVKKSGEHRFVIQKHRASHLHFDFRLEMDGVLKSWAVPKGPPLDPGDKRLAMQVEDHPVSYFDFEGNIPAGNYGAGTVMVWDVGTWEPLGDVHEMLAKGDLKFRLYGKKLKGEFVLARMRSKRPGSKGTEWLLIKKRDEFVKEGFDANSDEYDYSVLTKRSLKEIAGDEGSAEWESNRPAVAGKGKKAWLADAIRKHDKNLLTAEDAENAKGKKVKTTAAKNASGSSGRKASATVQTVARMKSANKGAPKSARAVSSLPTKTATSRKKKDPESSASPASSAVKSSSASSGVKSSSLLSSVKNLRGAIKQPMPHRIHPMLATLVDKPFDGDEWLFEVKFDGYRSLAFIDDGDLRLVSRNQNEMTSDFPELAELPSRVHGRNLILDGEICALDEEGRPSFSLMQQRTGYEVGKIRRRKSPDGQSGLSIVYYVFDLLYIDGYSLLRVDLEKRKELLKQIIVAAETIRYSEDFVGQGLALFEVAKEKGLEGIVGKRRKSCYEQKRSRDWLKVKITQRQECVIGGYTEPRGSREHFGSLVLGLYDDKNQLVPVGQAGSGFTHKTHEEMWERLKKLETSKSPFTGKPESPRGVHYVRPELVAEIKFTEWTHKGQKGGLKMRAPVFQGLRFDKKPEECRFELAKSTKAEATKAEKGEAA